MANAFIDMRSNVVRILVAEGDKIKSCRTIEQSLDKLIPQPVSGPLTPGRYYHLFEDDPAARDGGVARLVQEAARDAGCSVDGVYLIPPLSVVTINFHKLPPMSAQDAEKIVARRICQETREIAPVFRLISLGVDKKNLSVVSEQIPIEFITGIKRQFTSSKLKLLGISSPVHSHLAAFDNIRHEMFQANVLLDISTDAIEALYLTSGEVLHCERLVFPPESSDENVDNEPDNDPERLKRKMIYRIINSIYTVHSRYMASFSHFPVEKVWLSGMACESEGIVDALRDSMDAEVMFADFLADGTAGGYSYTSLIGLARSVNAGTMVNFLPEKLAGEGVFGLRNLLVAAAVASAVIMFAGYTSTESNYRGLRKQLAVKKQELASLRSAHESAKSFSSNINSLRMQGEGQVPFYRLFRDLSGKLPDGVRLDRLSYRVLYGKGIVELSAVTKSSPDIGKQRVLTRLQGMFGPAGYLKPLGEPAVDVSERDGEREVKVQLGFEVVSLEKTP